MEWKLKYDTREKYTKTWVEEWWMGEEVKFSYASQAKTGKRGNRKREWNKEGRCTAELLGDVCTYTTNAAYDERRGDAEKVWIESFLYAGKVYESQMWPRRYKHW